MLYLAAFLLFAISCSHSYLGEKLILTRLFKRGNIPHLFGGPEFTEKTLRFAWHITSICWLGFSAILIAMANDSVSPQVLGYIIGAVFLISFLITVVASKAKHYAWTVFLAVGVLSIYSVAV